jgi:hypothetical protein
LACSSTLWMEAIYSYEMSVYFRRTTRPYISEDKLLHSHSCEDLKASSKVAVYVIDDRDSIPDRDRSSLLIRQDWFESQPATFVMCVQGCFPDHGTHPFIFVSLSFCRNWNMSANRSGLFSLFFIFKFLNAVMVMLYASSFHSVTSGFLSSSSLLKSDCQMNCLIVFQLKSKFEGKVHLKKNSCSSKFRDQNS